MGDRENVRRIEGLGLTVVFNQRLSATCRLVTGCPLGVEIELCSKLNHFGGKASVAEFTELRWLTIGSGPGHYPI
jgi:hypothetical protein